MHSDTTTQGRRDESLDRINRIQRICRRDTVRDKKLRVLRVKWKAWFLCYAPCSLRLFALRAMRYLHCYSRYALCTLRFVVGFSRFALCALRYALHREVYFSRMAYLISPAMLKIPSLSMMRRR